MLRGSRGRDRGAPTVVIAAQRCRRTEQDMGDPNDNEHNHQTDGRDPLQGGPLGRGRPLPAHGRGNSGRPRSGAEQRGDAGDDGDKQHGG
jgi:hypothetical protein